MPKLEKTPLQIFREVFTEVNPPKGGLPTMPTHIADVPSDELGNMVARYTSWREYTEDRHAEACAALSQVRSEYDLEIDKLTLRSKASSVTEKRAEARISPSVKALFDDMNNADMYRELLARKLDSFSNVLSMLSRELTRRGVTATAY